MSPPSNSHVFGLVLTIPNTQLILLSALIQARMQGRFQHKLDPMHCLNKAPLASLAMMLFVPVRQQQMQDTGQDPTDSTERAAHPPKSQKRRFTNSSTRLGETPQFKMSRVTISALPARAMRTGLNSMVMAASTSSGVRMPRSENTCGAVV